MTTDRPAEYLVSLVRELCKLPQETEWAEFKVNNVVHGGKNREEYRRRHQCQSEGGYLLAHLSLLLEQALWVSATFFYPTAIETS